jgi:hypothetical protein
MDIIVISEKTTEHGFYTTLQANNKKADFYIGNDYFRVCVHNASYRAWNMGIGKVFHHGLNNKESFDKALKEYKSKEIKEMINYVKTKVEEKQETYQEWREKNFDDKEFTRRLVEAQ